MSAFCVELAAAEGRRGEFADDLLHIIAGRAADRAVGIRVIEQVFGILGEGDVGEQRGLGRGIRQQRRDDRRLGVCGCGGRGGIVAVPAAGVPNALLKIPDARDDVALIMTRPAKNRMPSCAIGHLYPGVQRLRRATRPSTPAGTRQLFRCAIAWRERQDYHFVASRVLKWVRSTGWRLRGHELCWNQQRGIEDVSGGGRCTRGARDGAGVRVHQSARSSGGPQIKIVTAKRDLPPDTVIDPDRDLQTESIPAKFTAFWPG